MKEVKVKLLSTTAKLPRKTYINDIGWDVYADRFSYEGECLIYHCGIAVQPPEGHYFELFPRSSQAKVPWVFCNSVGVIDPNYTGELQVRLRPVGRLIKENDLTFVDFNREVWGLPFAIGDRIAQLVLRECPPHLDFIKVPELAETGRGDAAFGSTGK